jgi:hypothetical protein
VVIADLPFGIVEIENIKKPDNIRHVRDKPVPRAIAAENNILRHASTMEASKA